jgi:hypothetical protein
MLNRELWLFPSNNHMLPYLNKSYILCERLNKIVMTNLSIMLAQFQVLIQDFTQFIPSPRIQNMPFKWSGLYSCPLLR